MLPGLIAGIGGLLGGLGGAGGKSAGQDAGNIYKDQLTPSAWTNQMNMGAQSTAQANQNQAAQDVMNNPLLSQAFGQGGLYNQSGQSIQDLMKPEAQQLTEQDKTALGQASGNITRQYGQSGQSLANALSQRGLGNSNIAAAKFSGLQGNQNEQLANLQTQMAQQRINNNMQRLQQMQGFYNQLGQQAQGAMGQDINANLARGAQQFGQGADVLKSMQDQTNEQLQQQQQGSHQQGIGSALSGATQGASNALGLMSGIGNAKKSGLFG